MRHALVLGILVSVSACSRVPDTQRATADQPLPAQAATTNAPRPSGTVLGEAITERPVALAELAKDPHKFENKVIATSGTVTAVCQSMGCWMEIKDDASEAHVKLAGHSFFVPKTASGHKARVQARVVKADPGDECAEEAAQQTGKPVAKLQLEATGVEVD